MRIQEPRKGLFSFVSLSRTLRLWTVGSRLFGSVESGQSNGTCGTTGAGMTEYGIERFSADEVSEALMGLMGSMDEAVVAFSWPDGVVRGANRAASKLFCLALDDLVGAEVNDFFYTSDVVRCPSGVLPFEVEGAECGAFAKTSDGSFVPVCARCIPVRGGRARLAVVRIDEFSEVDRERRRLERELARVRARLQGTLSIISCASLGEGTFEAFAQRVANELQHVMTSDAAIVYLADDYGFEPYGVSDGFDALGIKKTYLPMGVGVPTLVSRNKRTTRLQLVSPSRAEDTGAIMLDLDTETRFRLHSMLAECCSTIVGTPVFSYDRVVAVVIVGWLSPRKLGSGDVRLLETVADFLSVEFAAAVTQMEQRRSKRFADAMAAVRALVHGEQEMSAQLAVRVADEIANVVPSRVLLVEANPYSGTTFVRLRADGGATLETLEYPHGIDEVFPDGAPFALVGEGSPCALWVGRHTDLTQGCAVLLTPGDARDDCAREALLVMRGTHDRPFDDAERSFLRSLAQEVGATLHAEQERAHDAQIARALQTGLRNELPDAEGVTTSSLYISATESAVVGGDFFDLYDLSEGRIVVVMGDVSGKGVEAAAMASLVKTALAAYAWNYLDPASMVASLNNLFLNFSRLETFASLVVVAVDFNAMQATYCSAGHPPAMVVHNPGTPTAELSLLTVQSPIVGAFEGFSYANGTFPVALGDILYLYTDGTTEARNAQGDFFGEDSLRETLLRAARGGVQDVPQGVLREVEAFAGGELHDDIAMVAVRFDGLKGSADEPLAPVPAPGDAAAALDEEFARFSGKNGV